MGNFFTSTQIFDNEMLGSKQFIDKFCKKMAEEGYETCNSNESEISYFLKFADNCKWVTITSEAYEQGNVNAKKDTGRIAKMLKTTCINTEVIDSDCAIIDLYDKNGKKADTLIMGRADDYFDDDIPQPSEKIWKPFLCNGSTWEQFCEIRNGEYVFIEEGLSKLAPIIGIDDCNITFAADDTDEFDKNTFTLNFRKLNEKKVTLKAAFIDVFGKALEPLGFVKLKKTKLPYFVRIINNEIIHVITYRTKSVRKTGYSHFEVLGGVLSFYRPKIDFDDHPENWLKGNFFYYCRNNELIIDDELKEEIIDFNCNIWNRKRFPFKNLQELNKSFTENILSFQCDNNNPLFGMQIACKVTQSIIIPIIDKVNTLASCIDFWYKYNDKYLMLCELESFNRKCFFSDGLILILNEYRDNGIIRTKKMIENALLFEEEDKRETITDYYIKHNEEQISFRNRILDNLILKNKAIDEAESNKKANIMKINNLLK